MIAQLLVILVEIDRDTGGEPMVVIDLPYSFKIALPHGIEVGIGLGGFPVTNAVGVIERMMARRKDDRDATTRLLVIDIAVLDITVHAPCVEVDTVRVRNRVRQLSAATTIV